MKQAHSSHPHQKMRKDTEYETLRGVPGKQCTQQVLFPSLLSILRSWPAQHRPFMMVSAGFSERKGFRSVLPLCRPGSKGSKHLGRLTYCLSFCKITQPACCPRLSSDCCLSPCCFSVRLSSSRHFLLCSQTTAYMVFNWPGSLQLGL